MSHFSRKLEDLLAQKDCRPADLSRKTGISQPQISKWLNGAQTWISQEDLTRICKSLTDDPVEQAELVAAHCRDECYGPAAHLVQIDVSGGALREESPAYRVQLPRKLDHALDVIRNHLPRDKDLRDIMLSLARIYDRKDKEKRSP
jgi:DNA-binding Xre family transcriptional regulator